MNITNYSLDNFHVFLQIMNNSRKKNVEITKKTGSDEIYALLDELESDSDEDVDNEMNDSDTGSQRLYFFFFFSRHSVTSFTASRTVFCLCRIFF